MSAVKSNLVKLIGSNGCPNLKALEKTEEIESDLWKASEEDVVTEKNGGHHFFFAISLVMLLILLKQYTDQTV